MNDKIKPVYKTMQKLHNSAVKYGGMPASKVHNIERFWLECYQVMLMYLPNPRRVFHEKQLLRNWRNLASKDPTFEEVFSGEWIKVYKFREEYFLALSDPTWVNAECFLDRFD